MNLTALNPLQNAKEHMAFVMEFLVLVTGEPVPDSVQAKAKEVLQPLVEDQPDLSIVGVVETFEQVPELQHFAAKLRKAALPGAFGQYFASSDISCLAAATPEQMEAVLSNTNTKIFLKH